MTNIKFNVTELTGSPAFGECVLFCYYGLKSLGYETSWLEGQLDPEAINIVFGANMSNWTALSAQARHIIIFNLEQVSPEVQWFDISYFRLLVNTQVWDYNERNIAILQQAGVHNISHVPLGYCPEMSEIPLPLHLLKDQISSENHQPPAVVQDIDVLFYGNISPRRKQVLDAIRARGLNVVSTEAGQFLGHVRTELIARAKVILNVHYYESVAIFEIVRVSYLLANHKAVVSELSPHTDIESDIRDAIVSGSLDELPELCWQLVHDDTRRAALERKGFEIFSKRNATAILKPAVDQYIANLFNPKITVPASIIPIPNLLRLGAGSQWTFNALNIDARTDFSPDLLLDINLPIPFDQPFDSWRFGQVTLSRGYFNKIIAKDIFQCCHNFAQTLTNCLDLLADDGILELEVPYDLSYGAWALADTKRTFNEHTWGRLLNNWWQYPSQTHRFELVHQSFIISNTLGMDALQKHDHNWDEALKIPRAIDAIGAILRKRQLTPEEIKQLPTNKFLK